MITITSIRPSTTIDTDGEGTPVAGAVDAAVEYAGGHYGVTLAPRESDGVLDSWGTVDHWLAVGAGGRAGAVA